MAIVSSNKPPPSLEKISQALLEHACASITDKYGNIVYVSKGFCQQCGYSEQELLGGSHALLKSSNHSKAFYQFLWTTISSGNTWKGEICNTKKNGEHYWVEREITPLLDEDYNPEYYIAISKDITGQKALIRRLQNRAQQQGLIAILGQLSINSVNIQHFIEQAIAAVSGALEMKTGMIFRLSEDASRAVLSTSVGLADHHSKDLSIPLSEQDILAYTLQQDFPVISKDLGRDSRFVLADFFASAERQAVISLCIGDRRHPYGIMVFLSSERFDITMEDAHFVQSIANLLSEAIVRHEIEAELVREKELTRRYLDVADIIIIAMNEYGNILLANQKASSTLGLQQEDLVGLNWFDYFVPYSDREKARKDFGRFLRNESVETKSAEQGYLSPIITRQARTRLIKWNSVVINNEDNNTRSLLCTGEDVTEVMHAKHQKEQLEIELCQAQKMEALGLLAGGIAHDFNNILASILGFTDLSLEKLGPGDDAKLRQYLTQIKESGIRARNIIVQIQNYNRPGQGKLKPVMAPALINNTLKMMQSAFPPSVNIELDMDPHGPAVMIHPAEINQVIMHLLINARNALAGEGSIKISVSTCHDMDHHCDSCGQHFSGEFIRLSVADSGPGMDLSQLDDMLDPGRHPAIDSCKPVGGLASIHRIVHESNGHIRVDSSPDTGTAFQLYFRPVTSTESRGKTARQTPVINSVNTTGAHIMIVDDENSVASFLGELFRNLGFHTSVFTDPTRALQAFIAAPDSYDLVITDQTMPALSGDRLAQRMIEKAPNIPIILCTGHSNIIDEPRATAMHIRGFLKKPIQTGELMECVNRLLNERAAD
jgi:PAS domain S-box-containing protein